MRAGITLVLCAAALAVAPPALAGTVSMQFAGHNTRPAPNDVYHLDYRAGPGEANRLAVTGSGASLRVEDSGAPLAPGANCRGDGPNAVVCSPGQTQPGVPARVIWTQFDLGDGDDRLALGELGARVVAGAGDDEVVATGAPIDVDGGPGADVMRGLLGSRVSYADRTAGVAVTQDGQANDGEAGEHDDVGPGFSTVIGGAGDDELHLDGPADAGLVEGGAGNDRLFGASSARERLDGGAGDDRLHGLDGTDDLRGGPGADVLRGGADLDYLAEYPQNDGPIDVSLDDRPGDGTAGENDDVGSDVEVVHGTRFADRLVGSENADQLYGVYGADSIDGRGGDDGLYGDGRIVGGPGRDRIVAYAASSPPVGGTSVDALDGEPDEIWCGPGAPVLRIDPFDFLGACAPVVIGPKPLKFRVTRAGTVRMRLRCERGADIPCRGKAYVYVPRSNEPLPPPAARGRFSLPVDGRSAVVEVRLSRSLVAELRRARRLPMLIHISTHRTAPAASKRTTIVQDRTLLAPR
jgi:hypothetical protein